MWNVWKPINEINKLCLLNKYRLQFKPINCLKFIATELVFSHRNRCVWHLRVWASHEPQNVTTLIANWEKRGANKYTFVWLSLIKEDVCGVYNYDSQMPPPEIHITTQSQLNDIDDNKQIRSRLSHSFEWLCGGECNERETDIDNTTQFYFVFFRCFRKYRVRHTTITCNLYQFDSNETKPHGWFTSISATSHTQRIHSNTL